MSNYELRLSKFLSYILRHAPGEYNLELDKNGYADLAKVLIVLEGRFKFFKEEDLVNLVKNDPKGRFEIEGKKIRATYGHSVKVIPAKESVTPPEILYHGTSEERAKNILSEGLKPMRRRFVHLSLNEKDAYMVGLRHTKNPIILKIMAEEANRNGIKFFRENHVFLTEYIPKEYINLTER